MAEGKAVRHPVDVYAGKRLKEARAHLNYSQAQLGQLLTQPVTFQQIQKYERGINRISVSRLYEFMQVLKRPADYFLPDSLVIDDPFLLDLKEAALLNHYQQLSPMLQKAILELIITRMRRQS